MNLSRAFVVALFATTLVQLTGAQVPVAVSTEKTVIDGKTYYLHTVKQGETLYSISKAYNVLQKDIVFNNPESLENIRVGQKLKIPEKSETTPPQKQLESSRHIYHIAEKGQTAFAITKLYEITLEELYRNNPELEHSPLQVGQVVAIPKKETPDAVAPAPVSLPMADYRTHEVKRRETLFSISKDYETDMNRILEANPEIDPVRKNLKVRQIIKIPYPDLAPISIPVDMSQADTVIVRQDLAPDTCSRTTQKEFRIALLLPLFIADNFPAISPDTTMTRDNEGRYRRKDGSYWMNARSENAVEFYQGALLAIDSLRKKGLAAKILVFDTGRDTIKITQILADPLMKDMDLIIGPFYTEQIHRMAHFAQENRIFYISPVSTNIESLKNNPYLIQVNSGEINSVPPMADFIADKDKNKDSIRVILMSNKAETDQTLFEAYRNRLQSLLPDSLFTAVRFNIDSMMTPPQYLQKNKPNIVIVTASNEAFINLLAAQLNAATYDYAINLYGLDVWTRFVNLDAEYLHHLEFRFASAYHIDYTRKDVLQFLRKYRKYYHSEPVNKQEGSTWSMFQYAFLGYDVMFFFGSAMQQYGKNFGYCISHFNLPMLQSDFHFTKVNFESGHRNTRQDVYHYTKTYSIMKEKLAKEY
ncbi:MAG: LysM peptidoglycan-binding domain-containing protein [Bacteroidales bacterium]|nr:LysM peptidoglycan-binding domain-containing protein [Bacteroidales bacterium]